MPPAQPFARVDHLVVAVRELDAAARAYADLLGLAPSWQGSHPALGTRNVIFRLANTALELLAIGPQTPAHPLTSALAEYLARKPEGVFAIALGTDDLGATGAALAQAGIDGGQPRTIESLAADGTLRRGRLLVLPRTRTRGVNVLAIEHDQSALPPAPVVAPAPTAAAAVDHVVLFSDDLEGGLRLWRDTFGIPERWRRTFPERGTVNVGLRLAHLTLELVGPLGSTAGERGERPWGVAYTVPDCDGAVARVRAAGIATTDPREGLAPATRVATVRWPDHVPTLLIQHTNRRD
jgi:catechol 2,3-dioxygenase-like lactoylglutathione lyase family enzyme